MFKTTGFLLDLALSPRVDVLSQFFSDSEAPVYRLGGRMATVADVMGLYCERAGWIDPEDLLIPAISAFMDDLKLFCNLTDIPIETLFQSY